MRFLAYLALLIACSARGAAPSGDPLVAVGIQRAEESEVRWSVRDGTHPKLGPIKVAISLNAHTSYIGTAKILSTIYLSCEKKTGKIAIELTNARTVDLASGLKPKEMPRLTCLGVSVPGSLPPRKEIPAKWEMNELGDVLTSDLAPGALRACPSIEIHENILVPPALGKDNEEFSIEIAPYSRELDAVFSACGETSAYASPPAEKPAVVAEVKPAVVTPAPTPPAPAPTAPVPVPAPAPTAEDSFQHAHTVTHGRTNIRKSPDLSSAVVAQLPPGVRILVQMSVDDWWHVKSPSGATFEGYIRRDRFTLD